MKPDIRPDKDIKKAGYPASRISGTTLIQTSSKNIYEKKTPLNEPMDLEPSSPFLELFNSLNNESLLTISTKYCVFFSKLSRIFEKIKVRFTCKVFQYRECSS